MQKLKELLGKEGILIVSMFLIGLILILTLVLVLKSMSEASMPKKVAECAIPTVIRSTATAYTACVKECDDTPIITATNQRVRTGICGVSRDIETYFNMGDQIYFWSNGKVRRALVADRMNARWINRIDVLVETKANAKAFGRQNVIVWKEENDD